MSRKYIKATPKDIKKYWEPILKYGKTIAVKWNDAEDHCWACGTKGGIERSHIIPDCLGGTPDINNLVLLCEDCNHYKNPETIYPDYFWMWMTQRVDLTCNSGSSSHERLMNKISENFAGCMLFMEKDIILQSNLPMINAFIEYYLLFSEFPEFAKELDKNYFTFCGTREGKIFFGSNPSTTAIKIRLYGIRRGWVTDLKIKTPSVTNITKCLITRDLYIEKKREEKERERIERGEQIQEKIRLSSIYLPLSTPDLISALENCIFFLKTKSWKLYKIYHDLDTLDRDGGGKFEILIYYSSTNKEEIERINEIRLNNDFSVFSV